MTTPHGTRLNPECVIIFRLGFVNIIIQAVPAASLFTLIDTGRGHRRARQIYGFPLRLVEGIFFWVREPRLRWFFSISVDTRETEDEENPQWLATSLKYGHLCLFWREARHVALSVKLHSLFFCYNSVRQANCSPRK